jgi:ketosteroid isomerase-like protein
MGGAEHVVRSYFDKAIGGDPGFADLFAADASWWVPPGSPMRGEYVGREAVLALLADAFGLYDASTMQVTLEDVVAGETTVAVRFSMRAKTAKGRDWSGDYEMFFEVHDGLIRSVREFADTQRLNEIVFA